MKQVQIITDGACLGNPGPGGWAAILRHGAHKKELFGSSPHTTNNRMEMAAAIEGLRALKETCAVEMVTDSEYLMKGITVWILGWKRRNWLTKEKKPVLNKDLWLVLDELVNRHQVRWTWTRGHADHADNNRADELATEAAAAQTSSKGHKRGVQLPSYDLDNNAGSAKAGR
jgi:ribonuclease HI